MSHSKTEIVQKNIAYYDWLQNRKKFNEPLLKKEKKVNNFSLAQQSVSSAYQHDVFINNNINLINIDFKPGWLTTFLLLNMLFAQTLAAENNSTGQFEHTDSLSSSNPSIYASQYIAKWPQQKTEPTLSIFSKRITFSKKAEDWYADHPTLSSSADHSKLEMKISSLIKNKETQCKVKSILKDKTLEFELCTPEEIRKDDEEGSTTIAEYDRFTNKIKLPFSELDNSSLESFLAHEIHHAFVNYQNRKMNRKFYHPQTKRQDPNSSPCEPIKQQPGKIECTGINQIQNTGLKKVDDLLSIMSIFYAQPKNPNLTVEQSELLREYSKVIEGYQPMVIEMTIEKSMLEPYLKNKIMDDQLRFHRPTHHLVIDDHFGFKRYAYNFEYRDGRYIAKTICCPKSQLSKAPLLDLKNMLKRYPSDKIGMGDHIKEFDAVIHQLFEDYPLIYDFFFKGLREYHENRSESDYKSCRI